MSCTASYKRRVGENGKKYVTTMAQHQADIEQKNMQVISKTMSGVGTYYDYQPEQKGAKNVVSVVKFRKGKSKSVLRNPGDKPKESTKKETKAKGSQKDS